MGIQNQSSRDLAGIQKTLSSARNRQTAVCVNNSLGFVFYKKSLFVKKG
ncbi:MAG: hypothetical protein RIQ34_237 [Bacteroidota bacterium]